VPAADNYLNASGLSPATVPLLPLLVERIWPRPAPTEATVWIHGVSVGEVELLAGLAGTLREISPSLDLLLTSTTPAGFALLARRFGGAPRVALRPFPLDLPFAVRRFFSAVPARVLVLVETELWPAVLLEAGRRGVAVLLVNARLGTASTRRYRALRRLFSRPLSAIAHVSARTPQDAARFEEIGVPAERITVEGDMKLDRPLPEEPAFAAEARRLARGRGVWVAGSVADEELEPVIEAHRRIRLGLDAFLVLAPRRPESFDAAVRRLEATGLAYARRSALPAAGAADVLLLDTIGELAATYRLGDVAFLGGTFAPLGGHNVVEPLRAGLPTLHGPSTANIRPTLEAAKGSVRLVETPDRLADEVGALLRDETARARARQAAALLFAESSGATRRAAVRTLAMARGGA
jgi:3-deoxy-D-manno-octulosonic-acid transferase